MAEFIACLWSEPFGLMASRRLSALRTRLESADRWRLAHESPGLWIFTPPKRAIRVRPLPDRPGAIVGDLFLSGRNDLIEETLPPVLDAEDLAAYCGRLSRVLWGRYIALFPSVERYEAGVFRGPMSALDCVVARRGAITLAASSLPAALVAFLNPGFGLDWRLMRDLVAEPSRLGWAAPLKGVDALALGALWRWTGGAARETLVWRPSDSARQVWRGGDPAPELETRIDGCVRAWSRAYAPSVAELSGGLDSAIVGAALTRAGADVRRWVNFHVVDREGDERRYARAVAGSLGVLLDEELKPPGNFDPSRLAETCEDVRPSLHGLDAAYDARMAALAIDNSAAAIFTGQGGDVLFFGMSTPLLAVDHLHRLGLRGLFSSFMVNLARRRRQSIWALAGAGLAGWLQPPRRSATPSAHPWLQENLGDLPPAKRQQLEQLVYCLRFFGDCRRARGAELIHPLLSQPVVELCLSLPSDLLAEGGRDRGLARRAFAHRLPATVIHRRSKGDLTGFYAAAIARGLPRLRETLLGGCLVAHGAADERALDAQLDLDTLAVHGGHGDVMALAALEAWASRWQVRLDRARRARQG